jgi:hypothetical protein
VYLANIGDENPLLLAVQRAQLEPEQRRIMELHSLKPAMRTSSASLTRHRPATRASGCATCR